MNSVSPLILITFFGGLQGLFLVGAILRVKTENPLPNRLLAILLFLISFTLLGQLIYANGGWGLRRFPELAFMLDMPLMVYGPLVYLQVATLLDRSERPSRRWLWHFAPAALHNVHLWRYILEPREAIFERFATGNFPVAPYVVLFTSVQIAVYIVLALRMVRRVEVQSARELSIAAVPAYLKAFLVLIGLSWFAWFLCGLKFVFPGVSLFGFLRLDVAWILLAVTTSTLAFLSMGRNEVFSLVIDREKYQGATLPESECDGIMSRLRECMEEKKPHLEPRLTLLELAEVVGCTPKELSQAINRSTGRNFFAFVNEFRIAEFKRLAAAGRLADQTILSVALEAGFNSKSTFNAAFKKLAGCTPAQYLRGAETGEMGAGSEVSTGSATT